MTRKGLEILFEDADLLVVNKPPWLLSVPGRLPENKDSIALRAEQAYGEIFVVHRLDCATSGIMLLAKTKLAQRNINRQFHDRETQKEYIAIGAGKATSASGEVQIPLIVDWPNRPRQKVDYEQGKFAHTLYKVIEEQNNQVRMKLTPITGRSHQLRMHMLCLGLPIIGDRLYAPELIAKASERMLLHAYKLALKHPTTGEKVVFTAPCDF